MTLKEIKNFKAEARALEDYEVIDEFNGIIPFIDQEDMSACYGNVQVVKCGEKRHTTVIAYNGEEYFFWCGDNFIEGRMPIVKAEQYTDMLLSTYPGHKIVGYKSAQPSTGCHFWAQWSTKKAPCKHVQGHLYRVENSIFDILREEFEAIEGKRPPTITPVLKKMQRYAFKKHILLEGEKGSGKTYGAHKFIEDEGIGKDQVFFVGGHESLEAYHLLGQLVPYMRVIQKKNGTLFDEEVHHQDLIWKDGPLTAAFREASKGNKAILLIDEMLRIPQRELNILVAALTPDNKGKFTLRTERILDVKNSIASEEVIQCDSNNLWVIGTTNTGAGYAVDEIDEALADRFRTIRQDTDRTTMREILLEKAKSKEMPQVVAKLLEFYDKMIGYKKKEELSKIINLRHLSEAIDFASSEDEVKEILEDTILTWVDRDTDGYPESAQVELIQMTLEKVFKEEK